MALSDEDQSLIKRLKGDLAISPQMADYLERSWGQTALLFQAARGEGYKEGWNDRESDLLTAVDRIYSQAQPASPDITAGPVAPRLKAAATTIIIRRQAAQLPTLDETAELGAAAGDAIARIEVLEAVVEAACDEIRELRRYANRHGGGYAAEDFEEGLAVLKREPPLTNKSP